MRRFFGVVMLVAAIIAFVYGVEGNWPGVAVFGAVALITGFFWITSPEWDE